MRYCLIVNPYSRGGRGRALAERCITALARRGCLHDTEFVQDFQQACERLQIRKVQITYPGGRTKVGLGRCVDGAKAMRMMMEGRG